MMDFEHRQEFLLPRPLFLRRMARWTAVAGVVLVGSLALGVFGYHFIEGLPWIDALLNASMILGGMGRSIRCGPALESYSPRSTPFTAASRSSASPGCCSLRWFIASCTSSTSKGGQQERRRKAPNVEGVADASRSVVIAPSPRSR
jgi:hypothetical protein